MPSPFTKYTGEQIQPINILPYTAQIAETMGKGLATLGDVVGKYYQAQSERDELAQVVSGAVQQYVVQDLQNPEDKESWKADDNAPRHSADLINTALKEGDGDVARGIASMPMSKLRAWATLETKYQTDVQRGIENNFKQQADKNEKARIALAEENARLEKERNQILAMNAAAEAGIKAYEATTRAKEFEWKQQDRLKQEQIEKTIKDIQDVSSIPTSLKVKQQTTVLEDVGDIFRPDGTLIASGVKIQDTVKALGLDPSDVITAESAVQAKQIGADYAYDAIGKYLTQNEKFSTSSGFSGAVQNGYADTFIRNAFKQADSWSVQKTGKGLSGLERFFPNGIDGKIENPSKAFELAQKILKDPNFVDHIKKQGVQTVPDGAVFNKAYYKVTGTTPTDVISEKEIPLTDMAREKMRFDEIARKAGGYDKLPMSWTQYVMSQPQKYLPTAQLQLGDGTVVNVVRTGKEWATPESFRVNASALPETPAQADVKSADNWLRGFKEPINITPNIKVQFVGGINEFKGKFSEDYPVINKGFEDIRLAEQLAEKMRAFAKKGIVEKGLSPADRDQFNQLVMRATTFRRHFIAGGQETEPDAQRLFEQIGALTNLTRLFSSKTHLMAIDAFEATIRDQVVARARNSGFRVAVSGPKEKYDLAKIVSDLEKETGVKSTPKK